MKSMDRMLGDQSITRACAHQQGHRSHAPNLAGCAPRGDLLCRSTCIRASTCYGKRPHASSLRSELSRTCNMPIWKIYATAEWRRLLRISPRWLRCCASKGRLRARKDLLPLLVARMHGFALPGVRCQTVMREWATTDLFLSSAWLTWLVGWHLAGWVSRSGRSTFPV